MVKPGVKHRFVTSLNMVKVPASMVLSEAESLGLEDLLIKTGKWRNVKEKRNQSMSGILRSPCCLSVQD